MEVCVSSNTTHINMCMYKARLMLFWHSASYVSDKVLIILRLSTVDAMGHRQCIIKGSYLSRHENKRFFPTILIIVESYRGSKRGGDKEREKGEIGHIASRSSRESRQSARSLWLLASTNLLLQQRARMDPTGRESMPNFMFFYCGLVLHQHHILYGD